MHQHIADVREAPEGAIDFHLTTGFIEGKFVFIGVGGDIDGIVNLQPVPEGATVSVTLENGDAMEHDFVIGDPTSTESVFNRGESTTITFEAGEAGIYDYWCSIPGHRQITWKGPSS